MNNRLLLLTIAGLIIPMITFSQAKSTFTDVRDGKIYKTTTIGTQTWMAENLAFYSNSGCWAYENIMDNVKTYGYLYNWETAKSVCPTGWHLSTNAEWQTLVTYLGGKDEKLVEKGTSVWKIDPYRSNPPNRGTNETGFSALPGGTRNWRGTFSDIGYNAYWWSSTDDGVGSGAAYYWNIQNQCVLSKKSTSNTNGFSVRCLKD